MRPTRYLAAVVMLAGLSAGAAAGEAAAPLSALTALLPDDAANYNSVPIFTYLDTRAMERAAGAPTPESETAFDAWPREQQGSWVDATWRLGTAPQWLSQYFTARGPGPESMAAAVGFDMFAIDRSFTFGVPPDEVLVLAGDDGLADPAQLQTALEPRGFALGRIGSVPVWHRFEDYSVNFDDLNIADPFGGQLGRAARIAVLPEMLANAASWSMLGEVLAAPRKQRRGGSALATMLRAAVVAVESFIGPDAVLVQAEALPLATTAAMPPLPTLITEAQDPEALFAELKAQMSAQPSGPALPPYPLSVLADLQVGADQVNLIALPYDNAAAAATAADLLAERLRGWAIPGREEDGPLVSHVGGTVETKTMTVEGVAIAVVVVRYPLPDAAADNAAKPGAVFRTWLQAIYRRDFTPLALVN